METVYFSDTESYGDTGPYEDTAKKSSTIICFPNIRHPRFGLETVTDLLAEIGYERFDSYMFPDKHLRAHAYLVPSDTMLENLFQ